MQFIKMNYKGFAFTANPSDLKVSYKKKISQKRIPFSSSVSKEVSATDSVITGTGSFVGSDAMKKAYELLRVFNKKGSAYLFCADAVPIKAYFSELDISYSSIEAKVDYRFRFEQDSSLKNSDFDFKYTIARADENAFDIANRMNISVDKIATSNELEDLFEIREGDKIWLA